MKKYYRSYEPDFCGTYSDDEMKNIYKLIVNKKEYQDFECWLFDMIKSGVFVEIR